MKMIEKNGRNTNNYLKKRKGNRKMAEEFK